MRSRASKEYPVEKVGDYPVVRSVTVSDREGKSWTTRFEHNAASQVTRLVNPLGNGLPSTYAPTNSAGDTRARSGIGSTRTTPTKAISPSAICCRRRCSASEKAVERRVSLGSTQTYERLYNQTEDSIDALGQLSPSDTYRVHAAGQPRAIRRPCRDRRSCSPTKQGGGRNSYQQLRTTGRVSRSTTRRRRPRDEVQVRRPAATSSASNSRAAASKRTRTTRAAEIMEGAAAAARSTTTRNGRGLVTCEAVGPANARRSARNYRYDLNDNVTDVKLHVEDEFGARREAATGSTSSSTTTASCTPTTTC